MVEYDIFILQPSVTNNKPNYYQNKSNESFSAHFRIAQKPKPIYVGYKRFIFVAVSLFHCWLKFIAFWMNKKNEFNDYDPLSSWLTKRMKHFILIFWPQKRWWARPPFWWLCESIFFYFEFFFGLSKNDDIQKDSNGEYESSNRVRHSILWWL